MYMAEYSEFICPVKINSGNKALEHLPFELGALDARKPLVIAEGGAAKKGVIDVVIGAFRDSEITIGIFDNMPPLSDLPLIRELFGIYRDRGYDAIIAVGGGPAVDAAAMHHASGARMP